MADDDDTPDIDIENWVLGLSEEVDDLTGQLKQTRRIAFIAYAVAGVALLGVIGLAKRLTAVESRSVSTSFGPVVFTPPSSSESMQASEDVPVEDFSTKTPVAEAVHLPGSELSEKAKQIAEADQTVKLPEPPVA